MGRRPSREPNPGSKGQIIRDLVVAWPDKPTSFYADLLKDDVYHVSAILCAMRARGQVASQRIDAPMKAPNSHPVVWRWLLPAPPARPLDVQEVDALRAVYWKKQSVGRLVKGDTAVRREYDGAQRTVLTDVRALRSRVHQLEDEIADLRRLGKLLKWQIGFLEESFPKVREARLRRELEDGRRNHEAV